MPENTENTENSPMNACSGSEPTSCADPRCTSYASGHQVHFIQARLVGATPWGWRDAVVGEVQRDWVQLSYLDADAQPELWHHTDLTDLLRTGVPVRLHEQYHVLGSPAGWFNVLLRHGAGAIPEPATPHLWCAERGVAVVDNRTGRALPLDHVDPGNAD